jgi:hypothetical protein
LRPVKQKGLRPLRNPDEVIACATALRVDALTLMGEYLKAAPKATGGEHGGKGNKIDGSRKEPSNKTPTRAQLELKDKKANADAQALASLKEADPAHPRAQPRRSGGGRGALGADIHGRALCSPGSAAAAFARSRSTRRTAAADASGVG